MMPGGNRARLDAFVEAEGQALLNTLRYYVLRAGIAWGAAVEPAATELLNEVLVEAYAHDDRLTPMVRPWLLGIAANLIKRKQADISKRSRREPLVRDLYLHMEDTLSDDELFDLLPAVGGQTTDDLEVNEQINQLLMGVTKSDADLLRLAILHDLDGEALAKALGITTGAARVRLHRALNRLREAQRKRVDD